MLRRVAESLEARRDEIAEVIMHEVGMPKGQSQGCLPRLSGKNI